MGGGVDVEGGGVGEFCDGGDAIGEGGVGIEPVGIFSGGLLPEGVLNFLRDRAGATGDELGDIVREAFFGKGLAKFGVGVLHDRVEDGDRAEGLLRCEGTDDRGGVAVGVEFLLAEEGSAAEIAGHHEKPEDSA